MIIHLSCSGIDLCGCFTFKLNRKKKKICTTEGLYTFICFVFKAILKEIVFNLTAESILAAL